MVAKPGIFELPVGTTLKDIIFEYAGGLKEGKKLKAVIPGGMSAPILTPDEIDIPMDFDSLMEAKSMLGSGAIIVIDEETSMLEVLRLVAKFYSHESCGQCTPCRIGNAWISKTVNRMIKGEGKKGDVDNIIRVASNILGKTLCPLGDAAAMPVLSITQKFREELESHVKDE
jgi:NADH-quinone oxidoreductase subunit F